MLSLGEPTRQSGEVASGMRIAVNELNLQIQNGWSRA